jgi:4-hydroxy-2-oxoheptanedioate aldolase
VRNSRLKTAWRAGRRTLGAWCSIPSSFSAEIVASAGFDYVCVDMQHGLADFGQLVPMLQAISVHGPTPLVRVPIGGLATAQRVIDAGAEGVIFPMISTRQEALAAVSACRYPPLGERSFGPIRSRMHLGADVDHANSEVACIVMIETERALANLDEIVGCPGLDAIYVGPNDLSLALGLAIGSNDPVLDEAIDAILAVCRNHAVPAGFHAMTGLAGLRAIERGFTMATVATDAALLTAACLREFEAATGLPAPSSPQPDEAVPVLAITPTLRARGGAG